MRITFGKKLRSRQRVVALTLAPLTFTLTGGCSSPVGQGAGTGAFLGAITGGVVGAVADRGHRGTGALIGSAIGAASGALIGGTLAQISEEQREQLRTQSPQTLQTIQYNQQLAQPSPPPPPSSGPASDQPAAAASAPIPLKIEDIKVLTAAGVKTDVIIAAIRESKATYSANDIATAQQATPPVDPAVIAVMKNSAS